MTTFGLIPLIYLRRKLELAMYMEATSRGAGRMEGLSGQAWPSWGQQEETPPPFIFHEESSSSISFHSNRCAISVAPEKETRNLKSRL